MIRPDWDHYFLDIARAVSARATCQRAQVGGVVTDSEHRILATGYNGAPAGFPHCPPDESLAPADRCTRSVHVEQNILSHARCFLDGATWYFWPFGPCPSCQLLIVGTRPKKVVFPHHEKFSDQPVLEQAGVEVVRL